MPHTVVVLTIFTSLKLSTGTSCWDLNLQLQEVSVLLPSFPSLMAKVHIFIVNCCTKKTYQILEIFAWHKKKCSGNSIAVPHSIQHDHSTNSPVVHQSYIFRLPSVGLTQKRLWCFFFWYFWCEEREISRSHAYVLILIFLEAPHDVFI